MMSTGIGSFIYRLRGLSFVTRWNFHPVTRRETVAEHTAWVAIYAMMIASMEQEIQGGEVNYRWVGECVMAALMHDWEESVTGDLPSLVKNVCRSEWSKVEEAGFNQLMSTLPDSHPLRRFAPLWRPSNAVQVIVKAADLLDRVIYGWEEKLRGNQAFTSIVDETVMQLRRLDLKCIPVVLHELGVQGPGRELPVDMTHL